MAQESEIARQRQVLYWRLLSATFGGGERLEHFEKMAAQLAEQLGLPELVLDPSVAIDTLLQRYPALRPEFTAVMPALTEGGEESHDTSSEGEGASAEVSGEKASGTGAKPDDVASL